MRGEHTAPGGILWFRNYARYDRAWYLDNLRALHGEAVSGSAGVMSFVLRTASEAERAELLAELRDRGAEDAWYQTLVDQL